MKATTTALRRRRATLLARCERSGTVETLTHYERSELAQIDAELSRRNTRVVELFFSLPGVAT